jgi:5-hydroxyisourate hydrolase-like protein (transthyretin family)
VDAGLETVPREGSSRGSHVAREKIGFRTAGSSATPGSLIVCVSPGRNELNAMKCRITGWVLLLGITSVCLVSVSCSKTDPNRKVTVPVRGEVYVDGQPAAMLQIECHPLEGLDKEQPTITQAVTDDEGRFQLATYEAGDGAPLGEYQLTFVWQNFSAMAAGFSGPDKLKGRYKDPKSSEVSLKVEKGAPIDLGRIELSTN